MSIFSRSALMAALFVCGIAIAPIAQAAPSESDYKKAGPLKCASVGVKCAIGVILGDPRHRFKVYVSSDASLNGKALILPETLSGADPTKLTGQAALIQFSAVAGKQLLDVAVVGPAPVPTVAEKSDDRSKAPVDTKPITSIDLSHWKVTLPIDKPGKPGSALEVTELTGFTRPPYFDVKANSITFSAGVSGATTSGSNYPRSELREMDGSGEEYEWTAATGGTLSATLAVNELPTRTNIAGGAAPAPIKLQTPGKGRIVVGQIHGPDDELCRLYYDNGVLYFDDDRSGSGQKEMAFPLLDAAGKMTAIPLGKSFSYVIRVTARQLEVSATVGGKRYVASEPISSFWSGKPLYFKAGAYVQVAAPGGSARETGTGRGTVTFSSIKLKHP